MPHLNHKGPESEGPGTGRQLGKCKKPEDKDFSHLGRGRGLRRNSGGGKGKGLRLKSSKLFDYLNNIRSTRNRTC
jgi:hypothetical protein